MNCFNLTFRRAIALISSCFLLNHANAAITTGVYTVGAGGTYANLVAAITDLNSSTITGPVVFSILPGTYTTSDWQVQLNGITGSSAANTVTFMPQSGSGTVLIQVEGTSSSNYIFELNDVNYVSVHDLALSNTSTTGYGTVIHITGSSSHDSVYNCTLTSPAATASSSDMAVVNMGYGSTVVSGGNLYIANNSIQYGDMGITLAGASAFTSDDIIDNNTISNNYSYGMNIAGAGNIKVRNNSISANDTIYNTGMYLNGLENGLDVSGNNISINLTTPTVASPSTVYGMYNININSAATGPTSSSIANNTVSVTITDGNAYSLYNKSSSDISLTNNTFTATATAGGVVYPPFVAYNGTNVTATGNTFEAICNSGGIATDGTYRMISSSSNSNPNNVIVRDNIFNYETATGDIGQWDSWSSYYMYNTNGSHVDHNTYNINLTDYANMYGFAGHLLYNCVASSFDSNKVTVNAPYGVGEMEVLAWNYVMEEVDSSSCSYDTITVNTTYGEINGLNYSWGYGGISDFSTHPIFNNNTVTINADDYAVDINQYCMDTYSDRPEFKNNVFTINSSSGWSINWPNVMSEGSSNAVFDNNVFDVENTGDAYTNIPYACAQYGSDNAKFTNNTFTYNGNGYGTVYCPYYLDEYSNNDTFSHNTWNVTTAYGDIYSYKENSAGVAQNNTWNLNNTDGYIYNYLEYPDQCVLTNNTFNMQTSTGSIYGLLIEGSNTSSGHLTFSGNIINATSATGDIYAYKDYGPGSALLMNNVFTTNTSGNSYLVQSEWGADGDMMFFNNTFHSNSTGGTNTLLYSGNSGYSGMYYFYNNIFSRSNDASDNAVDVADTTYFASDYNLYYSPTGLNLNASNPSLTVTSLQDWRNGTMRDMNSLIYDPGFVDAANGNLHPDPANPTAWAIQGRGRHIDGDTLDIDGNKRAKTRFDGVPDLGAYEFTPTVNPPDAVAIPSTPAAGGTQVFTFGQDTVCSITWGTTVPSTVSVQQFTGLQANPMPYAGVGRMYFYTMVNTPLDAYGYKPLIYYKNPWLGDISSETNARIAKSTNGGIWEGFNYQNGITDTDMNTLAPVMAFDSLSAAFTGVENARIGKRCVTIPTGLNNYLIAADSAMEAWDPAFSPIGYDVIYDQNPSSPVQPYNGLEFTTDPHLKLKPMKEDTKYYIHVRTICGVGDTSAWALDSLTTLITCHAPQLKVTDLKSDQALVYWDTIKTAYAWDYVLDQNPAEPTTGTNIITPSKYLFPLSSGTTYYMHVRSKCSSVYPLSDHWSTISFTTQFPGGVDKIGNADVMSVYPNPVKDLLTISLKGKRDGNANISITDVTGKEMRAAEMTSDKLEINMSGLAAGTYIVIYKDNSQTQITKVNKQ